MCRASPGQERAGIALLLARLFLFAGRSADVYATTSDVGGGLDPSNAIHREPCLMLEATRLTAGSMDPNADQSPVAWAGNAEDLPGVTPGERALLVCLAMVRAQRAEPIGPILDMAERAILNGGDVLNGSDPFTPLMLVTVLQWSGRLEQASTLTTALMDQARTVGIIDGLQRSRRIEGHDELASGQTRRGRSRRPPGDGGREHGG